MADEVNSEVTDKSKFGPKGIPIESILYYAEKGLNNSEIAKQLSCSEPNISKRLSAINYTRNSIREYQKTRNDIKAIQQSLIDGLQIEYLTSNKSKIQSWHEYKCAEISKATSIDKEQIVINMQGVNQLNINDLELQKQKIRDKLNSKGINVDEANEAIDITGA